MGILNVTPDSFACHCSSLDSDILLRDCRKMIEEGATILDIGGCSTRPNSEPVQEEVEWQRLDTALSVVRSAYPNLIISIDTFRASIAQRAVEQYGVDIINDISGLQDPQMLDVVVNARVPYILTHPREACEGWTQDTDVASELLHFFACQLDRLHRAGVADVILDPGLGFGKTVEQNYAILKHIGLLKQLGAPVLIGLSRKSMLYKPLGISPEEALNATTAAHVLALMNGADILRVHDVREARQAGEVVGMFKS